MVIAAVMNIAGFAMMGADKQRARSKNWRIPEKRLFTVAAFGGALGVWAGMRMYRHKTQHPSFKYGIPFLLVINVIEVYYMISWIEG
ncbi:DUF1294 domain-containing protein [Paenibacillus gansuensis]|uniref:DUF1294 domain-containing protein n=1 Tax=Paenibacillus gansuensis TaxID=306542 RepID=A0ABW5PGP2_9BACL